MPKTADFIEETKSLTPEKSSKKDKRGMHPNSRANLAPYPKGVSGNPGGKPHYDVAAEIARAILEGNREAAYEGLAKALIKGNAYVFKELSDRAYGKPKETKEIKHIYQEAPDAELSQRIADLERELGLAAAIDEAGRAGIAAAGENKANGHAKDTNLLSR